MKPYILFFQGLGNDTDYTELLNPIKRIARVFYEEPQFYKDKIPGKKVNINKYITDTYNKQPKLSKITLLCHSIGIMFAIKYANKYADKYKSIKIISIDGAFVGKHCIPHIKRANLKHKKRIAESKTNNKALTDKHYREIYLINHMPVKLKKMPVHTVCFRNIQTDNSELSQLLKQSSIGEMQTIKNMSFNVYYDLTHFPYRDKKCLNDILDEINK